MRKTLVALMLALVLLVLAPMVVNATSILPGSSKPGTVNLTPTEPKPATTTPAPTTNKPTLTPVTGSTTVKPEANNNTSVVKPTTTTTPAVEPTTTTNVTSNGKLPHAGTNQLPLMLALVCTVLATVFYAKSTKK